MADRWPMTRGEALELARMWATGERSHTNRLMQAETDPADRVRTLALIEQADAAEAAKWALIAAALPRVSRAETAAEAAAADGMRVGPEYASPWSWWNGLTGRQQAVFVVAAAILVIVVALPVTR